MEQIMWIEPRKKTAVKEVSVSVEDYRGRTYTTIRFYNHSVSKVTKGRFIRVGVTNERMYFGEATSGYTLRETGNPANKFVKLTGNKETFVGDHDLQFDAERKLWFVGV